MSMIAELEQLPSDKQRDALISSIQSSDKDGLNALVGDMLGPNCKLPATTLRPAVSALIQHSKDDEELLRFVLERIMPRSAAFEEQIADLRETLAALLEKQHQFMDAARVLQSISLESGQRSITNLYKLKIYIRIVRCLLEEDEAIEADTYLNRAAHLVTPSLEEPELLLHFKLSQARILDAKRRFLDAAHKYYELSLLTTEIDADERAACLAASLNCIVLAPAGPARSSLLALLYKLESARQLEHFTMLEKMFLERLITPVELESFSNTLQPHQKALLPDGTTVLTRAVVEHNVLAASRIYDNIALKTLASLLGLTPQKAERFARGMIESGRLAGKIDQVSGIVLFESGGVGGPTLQQGQASERWDQGLAGLLSEVESIASAVEGLHPELSVK